LIQQEDLEPHHESVTPVSLETQTPPDSRVIVGMRVDATSYDDASDRILAWAKRGESRMVCAASVNNVMEGCDDLDFLDVMNRSDLTTADGMPLVWGLKLLGVEQPTRTYGPTLTQVLLERAEEAEVAIGFYGGSPEVLEDLLEIALHRWPALKVAYAHSPPFRALTEDEMQREVDRINASGARLLFVGIGTPKQDLWMDSNRGKVQAVMLGVGAAFDFIAGVKKQAPGRMQRLGLEWLFRLVTEPRRLWRRYLIRNPRFILLFAGQLIRTKTARRGAEA
jgi:N-acetylglucosaminyldiphosphoundecaprenol N-acetyl-beta-D-mannosaminyltransferase